MAPLYHYTVIRCDIPLGNLAAQLVHAAGESAALFGGPLPPNTHAIVLSAESEAQLLDIEARLVAFKIPHKAIREPDAPFLNQITAIGFIPAPRGTYKKFLSKLPLLKEKT